MSNSMWSGAQGNLMTRNFLASLVAVLTGNALYFLLMPQLPEQIRHSPQHLDFGLLVDFWICSVILGGIRTLGHSSSNGPDRKPPDR